MRKEDFLIKHKLVQNVVLSIFTFTNLLSTSNTTSRASRTTKYLIFQLPQDTQISNPKVCHSGSYANVIKKLSSTISIVSHFLLKLYLLTVLFNCLFSVLHSISRCFNKSISLHDSKYVAVSTEDLSSETQFNRRVIGCDFVPTDCQPHYHLQLVPCHHFH